VFISLTKIYFLSIIIIINFLLKILIYLINIFIFLGKKKKKLIKMKIQILFALVVILSIYNSQAGSTAEWK
jgi:uncharacterized membrane protein